MKEQHPEGGFDGPPADVIKDEQQKHGKGIKGKMQGFWENTVKPAFPEAITDINILRNMGNIEHHVTKELRDINRFPEIGQVAEVRRGTDLCDSERVFMAARREFTRVAFAKYIGVDESEVNVDDVPHVSFGGSGGGFRAMLGMLGYCEEMKRDGIWDILSYVSGVSGSCWAMAAYYSFGECSMQKVIDHFKTRLGPYHPLSSDAIRAVLSAPGGAHAALGPLVQKHHSGLHTVAMDLYSVFVTGHIFLHGDPVKQPDNKHTPNSEVAGYHENWFRYTNAQKFLNRGQEPLPILTAIRHERPWKDWADEETPFKEQNHDSKEHEDAQDAWFQWFEMTPYEIGCDEIQAWVPTWGFGRPFSEGKSTMQLPEQSLALLLGLCTSAPAGPLTSYLATINRNLPKGFIGDKVHSLAGMVAKSWGKQGTEEFQQHHPLHACNEHNFMYHYTPVPKGQARPRGLENSPRIHLIDSGMDNNCPTYVLLHPAREADVIINMDASSDVMKDTFQERVDQIGSRRGLKFTKRHPDIKPEGDEKDPHRYDAMYAQVYDGVLCERPATVKDSYGNVVTNPPAPIVHQECTMIYMPLLPNMKVVPDFDPSTAKFSGSYNLVWTPEQVQMLIDVCKQNFADGKALIKECLHEAWLKKKARREAGQGVNTAQGPATGEVQGPGPGLGGEKHRMQFQQQEADVRRQMSSHEGKGQTPAWQPHAPTWEQHMQGNWMPRQNPGHPREQGDHNTHDQALDQGKGHQMHPPPAAGLPADFQQHEQPRYNPDGSPQHTGQQPPQYSSGAPSQQAVQQQQHYDGGVPTQPTGQQQQYYDSSVPTQQMGQLNFNPNPQQEQQPPLRHGQAQQPQTQQYAQQQHPGQGQQQQYGQGQQQYYPPPPPGPPPAQ